MCRLQSEPRPFETLWPALTYKSQCDSIHVTCRSQPTASLMLACCGLMSLCVQLQLSASPRSFRYHAAFFDTCAGSTPSAVQMHLTLSKLCIWQTSSAPVRPDLGTAVQVILMDIFASGTCTVTSRSCWPQPHPHPLSRCQEGPP